MKHTIFPIDGMKVQKPIGHFTCHIEHRNDYVMNNEVVLELDGDILLDLIRSKGWISAP
jgi:hypothetical protein